MQYTQNGRWFPDAWWIEMGIPIPQADGARTYHDIADEEIAIEFETQNAMRAQREAAEQLERIRVIAEAEAERLRVLALRPPLVTRILDAFATTLFRAIAIPVHRERLVTRTISEEVLSWVVLTEELLEYTVTPGYIQIVNNRSDQVMSIMTDEYEIINDEDVIRRTAELFDAAQINVEPATHHVTVGKDGVAGRSTYMEFMLPDMTILPESDAAHEMRIIVTNSFDGTKKERLLVLLRSVGTGIYNLAFSQHDSFAVKHRTGANARLVEQFGTFVNTSVAHNAECINMLRNNNALNTDVVAAYLNDNRILSGERNAERLMGAWMISGTSLNLWEIYQLFSRIITENYGRNFGSKLGKMEQLNSDVRRVWHQQLACPELPRI